MTPRSASRQIAEAHNPVDNLIPVQAPIMLFGALATIVGSIFEPAGQILDWVAWIPLAYIIDGGESPGAMTAHLGRRMPFYDRYLDLVALSHPHDDHLVGLIECLERYDVDQVIDPGYPATTANYTHWLELLKEEGAPAYQGRRGALQPIDLGHGATLALLHPPPTLLEGTESDANNNSVVLRLVWGQVSFLFTGDIEEEGEAVLLRTSAPLRSTVMKAPHHGSKTSLSAEFLAAVSPQLAVICCGADNKFGHPHAGTLEKLEEAGCTVLRTRSVLWTDQADTVEVVTDGVGLWVHVERPAQPPVGVGTQPPAGSPLSTGPTRWVRVWSGEGAQRPS